MPITRESLQSLKKNYDLKQYNLKIDSLVNKITSDIVATAKYGMLEKHFSIKHNLTATYDSILNGCYSKDNDVDMAFMDDILYKLKQIFPDSDIQFLETIKNGVTERTLMIKWD
jgi:hypothetical protein